MSEEKKFYLTKTGLEKLQKEYETLRHLRLNPGEAPKIWESEDPNPEYMAFQEDLEFLETRLTELEHILKNFEIIKKPSKEQQKFINVGAKVLVEIEGQDNEFELVGTAEANPLIGKISNESPVGRALLGRTINDEIIIPVPVKTIYKIKKIKYS